MVPPVQLDPHSQLLSHPLIRNAESLPSYYTTVFKVFFAAFAILMSLRLYVRASSCLLTCASLMAGWVCKNSSTSLWCSSSASCWSWFSWWPSISTTSSAWCWSRSRCGGFLGNNVSHQRGGVEKDQGWWIKTWQPQPLWSPLLWKVLPWINILATPDDHVLHPPDNLPIPMLVNHCSVPESKKNTNWLSTCWKYTTSNITYVMGLPSMEPSVLPNHFISLGLVTPVAQHRRVPTGHKFALQYN